MSRFCYKRVYWYTAVALIEFCRSKRRKKKQLRLWIGYITKHYTTLFERIRLWVRDWTTSIRPQLPRPPQANRWQPPRNRAQERPNPHELRRIHLLPYPHQRTSERKHAWSRADRTCSLLMEFSYSCWMMRCKTYRVATRR